jgi:hypothetical protein
MWNNGDCATACREVQSKERVATQHHSAPPRIKQRVANVKKGILLRSDVDDRNETVRGN